MTEGESNATDTSKTTLQIGTPTELAANGSLASFIERPGIHFHTGTLTISVDR